MPDSAAPRAIPDLASFRASRGLTLEQIAEITKISPAYLRAIEEGCFERLPGGIYNLSYLQQYARVVGLDEDDLVGHYRQKIGLSEAAGQAPQTAAASRRRWLRGRLALLRQLV